MSSQQEEQPGAKEPSPPPSVNATTRSTLVIVLLTVIAQYALIVFWDRLDDYVCAPSSGILSHPVVHTLGCLMSWLILRRHRNASVVSWASWLLTLFVFMVPESVEDAACWWFHYCHWPRSTVFHSLLLLASSLAALCATGLARFSAGVAVALLATRTFDSVGFWLVDAALIVTALILDEWPWFRRQLLSLISEVGIGGKYALYARAFQDRRHGYAEWIGLVGFGMVWLRQLIEWWGWSRSPASVEVHLAFITAHVLVLVLGMRHRRRLWIVFGASALLLSSHLVLHSIFPTSLVTPLFLAIVCACVVRSQWHNWA